MKHHILSFALVLSIAACKQAVVPDPTPNYQGDYQMDLSILDTYNNFPVYTTGRGTLTVVKQPDGTYNFTERLSTLTRSYQATATGTKLTLELEPTPVTVSGTAYTVQYIGTGEFKPNSVIVQRKSTFKAGDVSVVSSITAYGYR